MDFNISKFENQVLVKINGSVRLSDADLLKSAFDKILEETVENVVVDLASVPSMSSLGIGKIIFLNERLKNQNRTMEVISIHKNLLSLFNSMKLFMVINIRGN